MHENYSPNKCISLEKFVLFSAKEKRELVNCIIHVPDLIGAGVPDDKFSLLIEENENKSFKMILREEFLPFLEQIDSTSKPAAVIKNFGKALWGSDRAGKSSMLFFIAQYCMQKGWVVFYIPNSSCISFESNVLNLLNTFKEKNKDNLKKLKLGAMNLYSTIDILENKEYNIFQLTSKIIDALITFTSQETPKAIIIDEWDKLISIPRNEIAKQMSCFNDIAVINSGVFFAALSSRAYSVLPSTAFRDASKNQYKYILSSFHDIN